MDGFMAPLREEALARLHFLADRGRKLGLLRGISGVGKTSLLRQFMLARRRVGDDVSLLDLTGTDGRELLARLAQRLDRRLSSDTSRLQCWRSIADRIWTNHLQRLPTILLLDNVDLATEEASSIVLRLLHLEECSQARVTIVLSVDARGAARLDRRLIELVDLTMLLQPWTEEEVTDYLVHELARQERDFPAPTHDAARRIHELTGGVPRDVARLVELTMLATRTLDHDAFDADTVELVSQEWTALPTAA
jgi:general secretion pathway protein A